MGKSGKVGLELMARNIREIEVLDQTPEVNSKQVLLKSTKGFLSSDSKKMKKKKHMKELKRKDLVKNTKLSQPCF
jgi:hypothetical protein